MIFLIDYEDYDFLCVLCENPLRTLR